MTNFENRIVLLTDLTALIRLIPHDNFPTEQRRDNFIAAAQAALDKEIEAEEEAEEYEDDDDEEYEE
ncbi:MAG: TyeA family type III secretion system gatekeeper subunit [Pseudomonadota bacterium]